MYSMNSYVERFISILEAIIFFIASSKMFNTFLSYQIYIKTILLSLGSSSGISISIYPPTNNIVFYLIPEVIISLYSFFIL